MTVSTETARIVYNGNGSTTAFPTEFQFYDDADLVVTSVVTATGVETVKTITTHYTVSGGDGSTGTVTMLVAPASGTRLVIQRVSTLIQDTDLIVQGEIPADSVETRFDKLTLFAQEAALDAIRAIRTNKAQTGTIDTEIPLLDDRAGYVLTVNDDEDGFDLVDVADLSDAIDAVLASPAADDFMVYTSGAWRNRTAAQSLVHLGTISSAAIAAAYQPLDSDLTAIAAVATTSYGRAFLALANEAALAALLTASYQPLHANLTEFATVNPSADGLSLISAADYTAIRAALSLGTAALVNTGTSGATIPLLNGNNTHSGTTLFSGAVTFNHQTLNLRDSNNSNITTVYLNENTTVDSSLGLVIGSGTNRVLTISGNPTVSQDYTTSGTPQFARLGLGEAADSLDIISITAGNNADGIDIAKSGNGGRGISLTHSGVGVYGVHTTLTDAGSSGGSNFYGESASSNTQIYLGHDTHATYAGALVQVTATRAGNSAYYMFLGYSNAGSDIEIALRGDGNVMGDQAAYATPADDAEMLEWDDGNPEREDRIGLPVVWVDGGTVRVATADDNLEDIFGVVSGRAATIKGTAWNYHHAKYVTDDFNRPVREPVDVAEWVAGYYTPNLTADAPEPKPVAVTVAFDEFQIADVGIQVPEDAAWTVDARKILNPAFDPSLPYRSRLDRALANEEWAVIGINGRVPVRNGSPVHPRWKRGKAVADNVTEWFVR